jgi:integrase
MRDKLTTQNQVNKALAEGRGGSVEKNLHLRYGLWSFEFMVDGRSRSMSFGPARDVPLTEALRQASAARQLLVQKIDPLEHRNQQRALQRLQRAQQTTFAEAAEAFFHAHAHTWRGEITESDYRALLKNHAATLNKMPIATVDTNALVRLLAPLTANKSDVGTRLRSLIERVLDYATAHGWRTGENPARRRGHLAHLLPKPKHVEEGHHPALPYTEVPAMVQSLLQRRGITAPLLAAIVLTATRASELRLMSWQEVDLGAAVLTIPGSRSKTNKMHRIPMSVPVLEIFRQQRATRQEHDLVFSSKTNRNEPITLAALWYLSKEYGICTTHGFRSSFRDWCANETEFSFELAEQALAHQFGSVQRAYLRSDQCERRRPLMDAWGAYCVPPTAEVLPFREAAD